jgi:prepilin-type N-terminal cleavage/methylation domain-containing protein
MPKKPNKKQIPGQLGFTLIELMVVISIITLISSMLLGTFKGARVKTRDAKRIADINNLAKSLELYYSDNLRYPNCHDAGYPNGCDIYNPPTAVYDSSLDGEFMGFLSPKYISKDALDPLNNSNYFYVYQGGGNVQFPPVGGSFYSYAIAAALEDCTSPVLKSSFTYGDPVYGCYYVIGMAK